MTDHLADERSALTDVFASPDPQKTLDEDGWFEALPEGAEGWDTIGVATIAAELAGARGADTPDVGARYAAAAALAAAGENSDGPLALALDLRNSTRPVPRGRLWGSSDAERFVILTPQGELAVAPATAAAVTASPLLTLRRAGVQDVELGPWTVIGDTRAGALHQGRMAHFLAAEAIGAAEAATARTLSYVREREQFGAPIGAQQVLQHRLVDMSLRVLSARTALDRGTAAWQSGDGSDWSWRAKLLAATHAVWAVENAIQLHGGIGFTEELGLGDALWRAQRARLLLGAGTTRSRVAAGLPRPPADGPRDHSLDYDPRE
jgi:hypothetical protein